MARLERVNELIYRQLTELLNRTIEFPLDTFVSVSKVSVSKDLKTASVWVSVFPNFKKLQVLRILTKKRVYLENSIRKKVSLKFIPNLNFKLDSTEEEASKIEDLINSVS